MNFFRQIINIFYTNKIITEGKVDFFGNAVIPDGTTEIADKAFYRNKKLRFAYIPASVRKIGKSAFADCGDLEKVTFSEGLEELSEDAFCCCKKITSLVLPDSVVSCHENALSYMGLKVPVYNVSGTVLFKTPSDTRERTLTIPNGVKKIGSKAIAYDGAVNEIVLPDSLEVIEKNAIFRCRYLHTLTIPASVKHIGKQSIFDCPDLLEITFLSDDTEIEDGGITTLVLTKFNFPAKKLRLDRLTAALGINLLATVHLPEEEIPLDHCTDREFLALSQSALKRDPQAMFLLSEYFREKSANIKFYELAANFWIFMSFKAGWPDGVKFVENWLDTGPEELPGAPICEGILGYASGRELTALGFSFFDPEREDLYHIYSTSFPHVREVCSWCGEDGPDEDGFGREEYYDWWLLDDMLCPIPGIDPLYNHSKLYMNSRSTAEKWSSMMKNAETIVSDKLRGK